MAQAHRIKPETPAIRVGILRFAHRLLRELCFWSLVVIALGMIGALVTFHPGDPAWTHTATATRLHNLGGVVGAWFADVTLYFFGHAAYLLPLGAAFAGWRLFKRGALLELDGEIVLFRVLGFLVTLATACGLASLHLRATPGTVPNTGSSGGLVGTHVGKFLIDAFGGVGGNLFLLVLLLAGVVLTTGLSWLTLLDWVGLAMLKTVDWIGGVIMAPLRWMRPRAPEDDGDESTVEIAPASDLPKAAPGTETEPSDQFLPTLGRKVEQAAGTWLARWKARGEASAPAAPPASPPPPAPLSPPAGSVEPPLAAPVSRPAARIEPVLNLPLEGPPSWQSPAVVPATPSIPDWEPSAAPDMRTLVPTSAPKVAGGQPAIPQPPPTPLTQALGLKLAAASNDPLAVVAPSPPVVLPVPWPGSTPDLDADENHLDDHDQPARELPPDLAIVPQPESAPPAAPAKTAFMVRRVAAPPPVAPYPLPPLNLLDPPAASVVGYSPETLDEMSRRVEILLRHFGIVVKVVAVEPGPVITRFEIEPAPGVKVSQISNLAKDLARGLSVISVRVVEIIPGKSVVGLEIPNQQREIVYLREVLETPVYQQAISPLTLALGKDISGNPVVANLAKMPHLLVAGTTGSGKSVAINAMLLSLLYKAAPREVRLILVDPKMLELSMYEDIPHLLTPVVTDMKEAANALRWCVGEMDRRYRLMAALKVRNIAGYNRRLADAQAAGEPITDPFWKPGEGGVAGEIPVLEPLPFIVVVIDELADMMMIVGKKVEELIARLAQKARASGIHLILATQRPSVDVITGLIKANIPTRIAFQVSSRVDSRTILDQMGAEQLLGHGDMLYLPPGTGLPQRVHGAFVDDHEVPRVVDYLRRTGAPDYIDDVLAEPCEEADGAEDSDGGGRGGESDPLYDEAVRIVTESRRASVSGVQRRLRIGYNRAARLVEEMESAGVVGPVQTNGSREVLAPPPP
ncbi:MAG: DNA translocase FtsK 4TM domain-containing protein [Candidatus Contendobacter sp.]|nr:DNA translocase FtsK 4TM domain-containing protein [Candidatus Contendobacter sp.]MDG4557880.1 DNA translocase FtsK 4TM domain-containing protein [Candidatus Contendobacter sp.]